MSEYAVVKQQRGVVDSEHPRVAYRWSDLGALSPVLRGLGQGLGTGRDQVYPAVTDVAVVQDMDTPLEVELDNGSEVVVIMLDRSGADRIRPLLVPEIVGDEVGVCLGAVWVGLIGEVDDVVET